MHDDVVGEDQETLDSYVVGEDQETL